MLLLAALALVALGVVLGGAGIRRLGWMAGRVAGRWRPSVGISAILLAFAALAVAVRGAWLIGLVLLVVAVSLAAASRRRGRAAVAPSTSGMSEAEARSVLGVPVGASRAEVQAAYKRLMQMAHPDHGGTSGLASQLNAARKRLLG